MNFIVNREQSFAGASQRNNISTTDGNLIFYGSRSNLIVANTENVIYVHPRTFGEITVIRCSFPNHLCIGDDQGMYESYFYSYENGGFKLVKIIQRCFNESIIDCMQINSSKHLVATTFQMTLFDCNQIYDTVFKNDPISCIDFVNASSTHSDLKKDITNFDKIIFFVAYDTHNTELFELKEFKIKNFKSYKLHSDTIKMARFNKFGNSIYLCTVSLDETCVVQKVNPKTLSYENKAVLHGHKDWVFSCFWDNFDLLTASADNSLILWSKHDDDWIIKERFGGISEKNQTFFSAFSINKMIFSQSISGGFYKFVNCDGRFILRPFISGHRDAISSIDVQNDVILSSSTDYTTRIFSIFLKREIARPQIHGYPISSSQFLNENLEIVSGAQECILRKYTPTKIFYESYNKAISEKISETMDKYNQNIVKEGYEHFSFNYQSNNEIEELNSHLGIKREYDKSNQNSSLTQNLSNVDQKKFICSETSQKNQIFNPEEHLTVLQSAISSNIRNGHRDLFKIHKIVANFIYSTKNPKVSIYDHNSVLINQNQYCINKLPLIARNSELSLTNEICPEVFNSVLNEGFNERNLSLYYLFHETKKVYGHTFEITGISVNQNHVFSCNKALRKNEAALKIWSTSLKPIKDELIHEISVQRLKPSHDKKHCMSCSRDGYVSVLEMQNDQINSVFFKKVHNRNVNDIDLNQENVVLASCSADKTVVLTNLITKEKICSYQSIFDTAPTALSFYIQNILIVGFENGRIEILDINEKLTLKLHFQAHGTSIRCIKKHPTLPLFVTGGDDGLINIFSITKQN